MNDIIPRKEATKHFYNVKLTSKKYICNMAICKAQDAEDTWSNNIHYAKMLYFCVCIAYSYMISLGISCSKDKKNNLLGATKNIKGNKIRIYSIFTSGLKWFKRAYYSCRKKYYLKTCFTLYQS